MLEIKTIKYRLDDSNNFDSVVNKAIADGWELVERRVLQPLAHPNNGSTYTNTMLYAELERGREPVLKEAPKADLGDVCEVLVRLLGAQATCWEADIRAMLSNKQETPEEEEQVVKDCDTCKYSEAHVSEEPCRYCSTNDDHWEPKEEEQIVKDCNTCAYWDQPGHEYPCPSCVGCSQWKPKEEKET